MFEKELHIFVPEAKPREQKAWLDQLQRVSMPGKSAENFLRHFPQFLKVLFLKEDLHTSIIAVVQKFVSVWNVLAAPKETSVESKGQIIKNYGKEFVKEYQKLTSRADLKFYMHLLVNIVPICAENCSVDIHLASGSAGKKNIIF